MDLYTIEAPFTATVTGLIRLSASATSDIEAEDWFRIYASELVDSDLTDRTVRDAESTNIDVDFSEMKINKV